MPAITANDFTEFAFITLKGEPRSIGKTLEEISRPGVDGHAFRVSAKRSPPFEMIGVRDFDDSLALDNFYGEMISKIQGQLCSYVDDFGSTNGSLGGDPFTVICHEVEPLPRRKIATAVGGLSTNKTVLGAFRFVLQLTVPPA